MYFCCTFYRICLWYYDWLKVRIEMMMIIVFNLLLCFRIKFRKLFDKVFIFDIIKRSTQLTRIFFDLLLIANYLLQRRSLRLIIIIILFVSTFRKVITLTILAFNLVYIINSNMFNHIVCIVKINTYGCLISQPICVLLDRLWGIKVI